MEPEWFLKEGHDQSQVFYKGVLLDTQSKLVFIVTPSTQIELMEVNVELSTMRDYLEGSRDPPPSFFVDKIATCLEPLVKRVYSLLQSVEFTYVKKGCHSYLDTGALL
ncbi:hypothetical protein CSV74_05660 [Sporosarcina sp. P19]|nr:hypothetical protein CSV74_05660 [Sporosarcina sp. P19]